MAVFLNLFHAIHHSKTSFWDRLGIAPHDLKNDLFSEFETLQTNKTKILFPGGAAPISLFQLFPYREYINTVC